MGTKVTSTARILWDLVSSRPPPEDDYSHHMHLTPMLMNEGSPTYTPFYDMVDRFLDDTVGNRGPKQVNSLRRHWEYLLLNLSRGLIMRHWTVVAQKKSDYAGDYWLKRYDLSHTHLKVAVDHLHAEGLIELLTGKLYADRPMRTRIFPKSELAAELWQFFLDSEQPIEPPYICINEPDADWNEVLSSLDEEHPDLGVMIEINEFLKEHHWACKGPIRMSFKHSPMQGGRLITPFQNLPDRRIRLRINTLIDGEPICEVDFSANHLRLNLALVAGEDAGETPYEDICELAGGVDRSLAKSFITYAMGASNRSKALGAARANGIGAKTFSKLEDATLKRYPKLELFTGFGLFAQNLEGQILKRVLHKGVQSGIAVLPVHDAVAVNSANEEWAVATMEEEWSAQFNGRKVRARLKVDRN